jgi:hypothetical protein
MRMRELRDGAGFAIEPLTELRIGGERVWQNLDRDCTVESRVAGFIHLAHATGAEQGQHLVSAKTRAGRQVHSHAIVRGDGRDPPEFATPMCRRQTRQQIVDSPARFQT